MANHAILSPSSAARWLSCTPSARLERTYPDRPSVAADEGTRAHRCAEVELKRRLEMPLDADDLTVKPDDEEMENYVLEYCDFVEETLNSYGPEAMIFLETRLNMTTWIEEGFGTSDVTIVAPEVLHQIDLKYGKGVPVFAQGNKQLRVYGLGGLHHFGLLSHIKTVRMTIHQPRLDSVTTDEMTVEELELWADTVLRPQAALAFAGKGDFVVGDHCHFCRASSQCRALAEENLRIATLEFKTELIDDQETSDILAAAKRIRDWLKAVETHALAEALKGKQWPGFKLVRGRSLRMWKSKEEVEEALLMTGEPDEHIYKPKVLLSPAQVEKKLGKTVAKMITPYIIKPEGKPTLVGELDKRHTFVPSAEDFDAFAAFAEELEEEDE